MFSSTVLFSPFGLAYGTLYSAILLTRPSRVVIVTSAEAIVNLHPALDAARFSTAHLSLKPTCFPTRKQVLAKAAPWRAF